MLRSARFNRSARARALALVVLCTAPASCTIERDRVPGQGVHPSGWELDTSEAFHGLWLQSRGYPLVECRACHGDDYAGGPVAVGCSTGDCHEDGVEACGTCHGAGVDPLPDTGAHFTHSSSCTACHPVPDTVESGVHLNSQVDFQFAGLATTGGAMPSWDAQAQVCSNSYCHGTASPPWTSSQPLGCTDCHGEPPDSHLRFARVAGACADCHPSVPGAAHLDGSTDIGVSACNTCHGSGLQGVPGPALDGSTTPDSVGVGVHQRHVDRTLGDRMGRFVSCAACHPVPMTTTAPRHIDSTAPADIDLPLGGTYDPQNATCVVWCHWDRDPGPLWTDDSGAARQCDSCHGFPPLRTRTGTAHPSAPPELSACTECHAFDPLTHVDGEVNLP